MSFITNSDPRDEYVNKGLILETLKNLIRSRIDRKKMELSHDNPDTLRIDKINVECDLLADLRCYFEMMPGTVLSCSGFTSKPEPATCDDIKNNVGKNVVIIDIAEKYGYRRYFEWATGQIKNENGKIIIDWLEIHEKHIEDDLAPIAVDDLCGRSAYKIYIWDESSMSLYDLIKKVYHPNAKEK